MQTSCVNVPDFYEKRQSPKIKIKEELLIATIDGEHKLRALIKQYLPRFIIDIYPVMEYLWQGAYIFHKEGHRKA